MTTHDNNPDAPQEHESRSPAIRISAAERRILVEALVKEFALLAAAYSDATTRAQKRRLQTEIKAFGTLLHKLQGSTAVNIEPER